MFTSASGIEMIQKFEGLRLKAYKDSVGVWTIGYGHTGGHIHKGMHISEERAHELLAIDLDHFERCVGHFVKVNLTQGEFDALVSFAYNLGCEALRKSTLLKKLNDKDYEGAAQEFARWTHAGHKVLKGLVARREQERERFIA